MASTRSGSCEPTFHLFPKLPTELRLAIWRQCLPHRVAELDIPIYFNEFKEMISTIKTSCHMGITSEINASPPLLAQVCRESREVAFETGRVFDSFPEDMPEEAQWDAGNTICPGWLDLTRDSVHLNWNPWYEMDFPTLSGCPLECLAWFSGKVPRGASFMLDYLTTWQGEPSMERRLEIINWLPSWRVVVRIVVIHTDARTGAQSSLFGLLGDAPVQLIDVYNEMRVSQFLDFAARCYEENHIPVDLHRDSADSMMEKMRESILEKYKFVKEFKADEIFPKLRPAIMFRLCMCNMKRRSPPSYR